jgi:hypothetical protein
MAKEAYPEKLDNHIFDAVLKVRGHILDRYPEDALISSMVRQSFITMQPMEQVQIVDKLGPDWMVKIAAKVEKKLSEIDKQGAS